jgi:hypothetical protein
MMAQKRTGSTIPSTIPLATAHAQAARQFVPPLKAAWVYIRDKIVVDESLAQEIADEINFRKLEPGKSRFATRRARDSVTSR